jgi:hypothetical protein
MPENAPTVSVGAEKFYTKAHDRLCGLTDDGIEFEEERVKEAFDVGFRLLKLYDEYENLILEDILEKVKAKTR